MLSVKIDDDDFNYLLESSLDPIIRDTIKHNHTRDFNTIYLNLEKKIANIILDFLGTELMRIGLNKNDEPNEIGIKLESIIDKFSREVYNNKSNDFIG